MCVFSLRNTARDFLVKNKPKTWNCLKIEGESFQNRIFLQSESNFEGAELTSIFKIILIFWIDFCPKNFERRTIPKVKRPVEKVAL